MWRGRTYLAAVVLAAASAAAAETHFQLQAVDAGGNPTHPKVDADPVEANLVVIEGICLNNPEAMVDPAWEWQIFVQGEGGDLGGTAIWAGKFYYLPDEALWQSELARWNGTGLREGDRVRVTGYAMSVGGKANINERHSPAPMMDFQVELLAAGVGLPQPELVSIAEMNVFQQDRLSGGERYQCRRIRIDDVVVQELLGGQWGGNQDVLIADASDPENPDKQILLALRNADFGSKAPATWFDVVGLGNQEPLFDGGPIPGTGLVDGYQVWVTRPDGIIVPGDANRDAVVDGLDYNDWSLHYLLPGGWEEGDYNGDGVADGLDYNLWSLNYGYGAAPGEGRGAIPEPFTLALLGLGAVAALKSRRASRPGGR
jgi:hypothetical protein